MNKVHSGSEYDFEFKFKVHILQHSCVYISSHQQSNSGIYVPWCPFQSPNQSSHARKAGRACLPPPPPPLQHTMDSITLPQNPRIIATDNRPIKHKAHSFSSAQRGRPSKLKRAEVTVSALGRQAVAHPLYGDGGEVDAGDPAGDALPQQLLPEPRVAAPDLKDLHAAPKKQSSFTTK